MIKNDTWIRENSRKNQLISPFEEKLINYNQERKLKILSFGLGSYGYDIRLSPKEFWIFKHVPGSVVDPKKFNPKNLEKSDLFSSEKEGDFFILPSHSYGLGVSVEKIQIPANISCLAIGKSTYARCGIIANTTPAEPGWKGYLTLEFSNSSGADCKIYANEGVVQLLFFEGELCERNYEQRSGKYQNQKEQVTIAKV